MALRPPNDHVIFLLVPLSKRAKDVVQKEHNRYLVAKDETSGEGSLAIGFSTSRHDPSNILARVGRDPTRDITLPLSQTYHKKQCTFMIDDPNTGLVMLHDDSYTCLSAKRHTEVFTRPPSENMGFAPGNVKVALLPKFNNVIKMGGRDADMLQFEVKWLKTISEVKAMALERQMVTAALPLDLRDAPTVGSESIPGSGILSPTQAFQESGVTRMRLVATNLLGSGSYARVTSSVDVDTGKIYAVKRLRKPAGPERTQKLKDYYAEVELMRVSKHNHVTPLITSQGWEDASPHVDIIMAQEEGTLSNLLAAKPGASLLRPCVHHMLQALDFLDFCDIIHRDLKPDNILYSTSSTGFGHTFRLADFGSGKLAPYASSCEGTDVFMAPEILSIRGHHGQAPVPQTPKADVWSLFVTIIYIKDIDDFRKLTDTYDTNLIRETIRNASQNPKMAQWVKMGREDPALRAFASDILIERYGGSGLYRSDIDRAARKEQALASRMNDVRSQYFQNDLPSDEQIMQRLPQRSLHFDQETYRVINTWPGTPGSPNPMALRPLELVTNLPNDPRGS